MYCKYCGQKVDTTSFYDDFDEDTEHQCPKKGLLRVSEGSSFLVSTLIGFGTDSALLGGLLGGDIIGGIAGDLLDGELFD